MIEKLWDLLTTITLESQNAVFNKCSEYGFNIINRGAVSLDESFINLNFSVDLLRDLIEKKKLIQLPVTIQKSLITALEQIVASQASIISGSDAVENLVIYVESLNTLIWQYGLHNLSDQVLGYQTKLNQIKQLELEVSQLKKELQSGVKTKEKLDSLFAEISVLKESVVNNHEQSTSYLNQVEKNFQDVAILTQQVSALYTQTQQNDSSITQFRATASQSSAEIQALETKAKAFFAEVAEFTDRIDLVADKAEKTLARNIDDKNTLITELKRLEVQIKDQLEKATGYSLFHSFQTRQVLMVESKNFWLIILAVLLAITLGLAGWLAYTMSGQTLDALGVAFYLKLALTVPLVFAISFSTIQYSRERRLEEEYAFKSNISISLIPYQELVEKLVNTEDEVQRKEYAQFIIGTINKIFTSPTEEIFKDKKSAKGAIDETAMKSIGQIADLLSKFKPSGL